MRTFNKLGVSSNLSEILLFNGLSEPTEIQERSIPLLLTGKDIVAQAQTGTGKTLAFLLPIIERINTKSNDIQALIVTPTRELAIQITAEANKLLSSNDNINVLSVYGGQDVEQQIKKLKRSHHIVVGTPGRLLDHLRRGTIDLTNVAMLVLDEADQMLNIGFLPEIKQLIKTIPTNRQTMLFSATMPPQIRSLAANYMIQPEEITVQSKHVTVDEVSQFVVETSDRAKQDTLKYLIDEFRPFLAIIFCRTKRRAKTLNEALQIHGFQSDELHGDLSQSKREKVIKRFREVKLQFLIATDVAARGLDIEGVTHVFNYDIPNDVESYIHRIGRTGRAGEEGLAITLVAPKDKQYLQMIEKGIGFTIDKKVVALPKASKHSKTEENNEKSKTLPSSRRNNISKRSWKKTMPKRNRR